MTGADCHTLATLLADLGQVERALSWVKRGLTLNSGSATGSSARFDLTRLKPRLLADLGRTEDPRVVVWAHSAPRPDRFSFDELLADEWVVSAPSCAPEPTAPPPLGATTDHCRSWGNCVSENHLSAACHLPGGWDQGVATA